MATTMPYNAQRGLEDDQMDGAPSIGTAGQRSAPGMYQPNEPQQRQMSAQSSQRQPTSDSAPPPTFAQMRDAGYARPPMPQPPAQNYQTVNSMATDYAAATPPGGPSSNSPDILGMLLGNVQGNGAGSQVQQATQRNTLDLLNNPSAYGLDQVKDAYGYLGGQIDDQFAVNRSKLGDEMARRGLGASTINAGRLNDLNIGQRDAKTNLAYDLAHQYASGLDSARQGAISAGNTVGTTAQNNNQSALQQLMNYGQQGFQNDLATNQANQSASDSYRNFILQLLGMGYGGSN